MGPKITDAFLSHVLTRSVILPEQWLLKHDPQTSSSSSSIWAEIQTVPQTSSPSTESETRLVGPSIGISTSLPADCQLCSELRTTVLELSQGLTQNQSVRRSYWATKWVTVQGNGHSKHCILAGPRAVLGNWHAALAYLIVSTISWSLRDSIFW